jgi:hypothetical protein
MARDDCSTAAFLLLKPHQRGAAMHRFLITAALVLLGAVATVRPAAALPEPFVGIGASTFGLPGGSGTSYGLALEGGVDDILSDIGAGLRIDAPFSNFTSPLIAAQFRYNILKIPFVRLLAGLDIGVKGTTAKDSSWNGAGGAWAGARVSLGLPYIAAIVGLGYVKGGGGDLYSAITLGVSF